MRPDETPTPAGPPLSPSLDLDPPRRVAVLRALPGLGDLLCGVPALRALRAAWPDAHITLVGLPGAAWFATRFHAYVDDLLPVTAFPGLPELDGSPQDSLAFLAAAQGRRFDLAVQLHGSGVASNALLVLLGARRNAGSFLPGYCPDPQRFVAYRGAGHEIDRLLEVVRALGVADQGRHLEWPQLPGDDAPIPGVAPTTLTALPGRAGGGSHGGGPEPIACLHPGSSLPSRRWPVARFAQVGDHLTRSGLRVVVTGTAAERPLAEALAGEMHHPATVVAGRTSLGQLASLLAAAAVVVTNDTGTSHLAAAVRAPSVVLFTVSDVERWAPLDRARHRVVAVNGPTGTGRCASERGVADGCASGETPVPLPDDGIELVLAHCDDLLAGAADLDRASRSGVGEAAR
jgi:ADP-heptose:LPS heptosyltransferase